MFRRMAKRYQASKEERLDWINANTVIIRLKPRQVIRVW